MFQAAEIRRSQIGPCLLNLLRIWATEFEGLVEQKMPQISVFQEILLRFRGASLKQHFIAQKKTKCTKNLRRFSSFAQNYNLYELQKWKFWRDGKEALKMLVEEDGIIKKDKTFIHSLE